MKVIIAAENASMKMSGEAALALYYFDRLHERNVNTWLVCHERVREELRQRYPDDRFQRIRFVKDSWLQVLIHKSSDLVPFQIQDRILGQVIHLITQSKVRPVVKQLVQAFDIQLVFEPAPISPKAPSYMYGIGVPVVIGPMCGGMEFPPAFQYLESSFNRLSNQAGRAISDFLNRFIPGKLQADILLVANKRTANALPSGYRGKVYEVVESGVDLSLWQPIEKQKAKPGEPTRFVYMARFVDQKGIPYLVEAFKQVAETTNSVLELIGSGELLEATKAQVAALNIQDRVNFHGWMALDAAAALIRECDVYMVPAIRDCGGCAMLEAMAIGMPVIAANWAGPGQYADASCGILVDLDTEEAFVNGLAEAMIRLAQSPDLREQMGEASKHRVRTNYLDWDAKVDRVVEVFEEAIAQQTLKPAPEVAGRMAQSVVSH
ncbi:MAG: glycosyltransferase family 4 protein [Lyngbya sp. HA4199-MV5]|jgi:glycosyltransferase involved in cell wall biosynthesis|nr:glycosyltransferase family 4 protein [Lyngbya sp. HA4199-MV5]